VGDMRSLMLGKKAIASTTGERSSLLGFAGGQPEKQSRIVKAAFYGVQVFYSFFIMYVQSPTNGTNE
jgi:hypothetical protein